MSEQEWEEMNKVRVATFACIDDIYNNHQGVWQAFHNEAWIDIHPRCTARYERVRRRKDTKNWVAEEHEAGDELTYLEAVFYYILNGNSLDGLEEYNTIYGWQTPGLQASPNLTVLYRIVPKKPMVTVNGHKVPKWETEPLEMYVAHYVLQLHADEGYSKDLWHGKHTDYLRLKNGCIYKNEADIKKFVKALRDIKDVE